MHYDPQAYADKIDGLIQRYRNGEFSTVVFAASLKAARMRGDEIADLIGLHIWVHQSSLPYRRGDIKECAEFTHLADATRRVVERIKP